MGVYSEILSGNKEIQKRIQHSKEFLGDVRKGFGSLKGGMRPEVCVFAAGSLGRFEAGRISDLDVFILSHSNEKTLKVEAFQGWRKLSSLQI